MHLFFITLLKYSIACAISVLLFFGLNDKTSLIILKIWLFPFFGGINSSIISEKKITPTLSLFFIAEKAKIADNSVAISL